MSEVSAAKFSCEGCGKSYKWKPEFAGRKVKCKCGFVMTMPSAPPEAPDDEPDLDALYSLAQEGKAAASAGAVEATIRCPSCKAALEPGTTVCEACGFNLKTGGRGAPKAAAAAPVKGKAAAKGGAPSPAGGAFAAFGAPRNRGAVKEEAPDFKAVELYVPIGMLIAGIAVMTLRFMKFYPTNEPVPQALMYTGVWLAIMLALMVVGGVLMIRFMEMAFGDPLLALLKMSAIVLLPTAVAWIISFLIHDAPPVGWGLVGFFLAFGMFFVAYHYLFDFDMSEMWIIVGYTTMVCMMGAPFVFALMIATDTGGSLASKGAKNDDADVDYIMDLGWPKEAFAWINDGSNRQVGETTNGDSKELFNSLKEAGATEIQLAVDGPQACEVYVKMPSNAAKRKAIADAFTAWNAKFKRAPAKDEGGKWLIQRFLPFAHPQKPY